MTDKRSLAIILGTAVGIAAVAVTVGIYVSQHNRQPVTKDVNEILEDARETVERLNKAVEQLRRPA